MRKYVAEFRVEQVGQEPSREAKSPEQIVNKERTFPSKTVGKVLTTGVGMTLTTSRIYAMYQGASNSIVGDSVAQRQFDNSMAYLNEGLSLFGTFGIAALINPAALGLAAVGQSINYTLKAVQLGQENRVKQASWEVERIINAQKQSRLVKDITGIRV